MVKKKQKYSAAERRAFWIGVGRSLSANDTNAKKSAKAFADSLSVNEKRSYQQGIVATIYKPDMFKKRKRR